VRRSLGATRGRLIRQLLTESLLLASMGGALGIAVGYWGKQLLPGAPGRAAGLDWRVLAFVLVVTGVTGIVFGIAPALRGTAVDVNSGLKETRRGGVRAPSFLSKAPLFGPAATSVVLFLRAGLCLRPLAH